MIKLTAICWENYIVGQPLETEELWVKEDQIVLMRRHKHGSEISGGSKWRTVTETPEQILELMYPPMSDEQLEMMKKFGIEIDNL